jgi:hypothetical protein
MSRSGYSDDLDNNQLNVWRGQVASAIRGKRGQMFLLEMLASLDALPRKELIKEAIVTPEGPVCAMGAVARRRGTDTSDLDPDDADSVAARFGIARQMAMEIAYVNDEQGDYVIDQAATRDAVIRQIARGLDEQTARARVRKYRSETNAERFIRVRAWVVSQIRHVETASLTRPSRGTTP